MGQSVMDKNRAWQRKHLRLVLHPAERRGKDDPVLITLKFRAVIMAQGMIVLLPQSLARDKLIPIHTTKV